MKARGGAEQPENVAHRGKVARVGVAEKHDVVRVEGEAGGHVTISEPLQEAQGGSTLEEVVEDVNDDHEEHGGHGVALAKPLAMTDR